MNKILDGMIIVCIGIIIGGFVFLGFVEMGWIK